MAAHISHTEGITKIMVRKIVRLEGQNNLRETSVDHMEFILGRGIISEISYVSVNSKPDHLHGDSHAPLPGVFRPTFFVRDVRVLN